MNFHHIGIAVFDINSTKKYYESLGYSESYRVFDPLQNVNLCFLTKENSPMLELVCPVDDNSPVNNILKKSGVTSYHTCYEVNNIVHELKCLKEKGFIQLTKITPAIAFNSRNICFVYNKNIGVIELLNK